MKLLGAQEPVLQRSGAKRVRRLADSDDSLRALLREQAPARLLALLHADADAGKESCRDITGSSMQLSVCAWWRCCCRQCMQLGCNDHIRCAASVDMWPSAGVVEAVLDALATLSRLEEGREACVLAGKPTVHLCKPTLGQAICMRCIWICKQGMQVLTQ